MRKLLSAALAGISVAVLVAATAHAQSQTSEPAKCTPEQFGERIDETGEYLRTISRKTEPELRRKFQSLARARGWAANDAEERGYELIQDATIASYDQRARSLLIELDKIGAVDAETATCAKLQRLEAVTFELRAVSEAKAKYVHQRLDAALSGNAEQAAKQPSPTSTPQTSPPSRVSASPRQPPPPHRGQQRGPPPTHLQNRRLARRQPPTGRPRPHQTLQPTTARRRHFETLSRRLSPCPQAGPTRPMKSATQAAACLGRFQPILPASFATPSPPTANPMATSSAPRGRPRSWPA